MLATERGERAFAEGDRVYFLRNERGLGVKNGTLGTVERITGSGEQAGLVVRLDGAQGAGSGQAVSFALAEYADIDHGYAATVHKSQGVTVDRAHVLATELMDRHATYVGLTRHRDAVAAHYSQAEFATPEALTRVLGRERLKDTSLDYGQGGSGGPGSAAQAERERADLARAYAKRRGVFVPESEIVVPVRTLGVFDGLSLGRGSDRGRAAEGSRSFDDLRLSSARPDAVPPQREAADPLVQAVERYARAWTDATRMRQQDLLLLEHQKAALRQAGEAMNAARPNAVQDLQTALQHNPAVRTAMAQLKGRERASQLVDGIRHEERVRQDPVLRSERRAELRRQESQPQQQELERRHGLSL